MAVALLWSALRLTWQIDHICALQTRCHSGLCSTEHLTLAGLTSLDTAQPSLQRNPGHICAHPPRSLPPRHRHRDQSPLQTTPQQHNSPRSPHSRPFSLKTRIRKRPIPQTYCPCQQCLRPHRHHPSPRHHSFREPTRRPPRSATYPVFPALQP